MLTDYLIVAGSDRPGVHRTCEIEARTGLELAVSAPGFRLFVTPATELVRNGAGNEAVLIGTIFTAGPPSQRVRSWPDETAEAVRGGGLHLLTENYWGSYVAVAQEKSALRILRSPSGALPCYYVQQGGTFFAAASARLLMRAGATTGTISWSAVARHLVWDQFLDAQTCLDGVCELLPGMLLDVDAEGRPAAVAWTPWSFASRDGLILDRDEAVRRVRAAVLDCVAAWASVAAPVLLRLSGGLDSSIVAASLAAASVQFSCLTMTTEDAAGDERTYARLVAGHFGVPLEERFEDPKAVQLEHSEARDCPRPVARAFGRSANISARIVARETGAASHFDGGGGDAVFCYLQSVAPVADRWLVEGLGRGVWQTASDMSGVSDTAILRIASKAAARARADPAFRLSSDLRFLSASACASLDEPPRHDWLRAPAGALPGKSGHIAWLHAMHGQLDQPGLNDTMPVVSPLMSQPVIEACLRVPTWFWCDGGRNRAIARMAFASMLPGRIIERFVKGTPNGFVAQIFDERRREIRALLLNGNLAAAGLLDLPALAGTIDHPGPVRGDAYARIMRLVDVEAWTRHWKVA